MGYRMSRGLPWVCSLSLSLSPVEPGYPRMVLFLAVHTKRGPQIVSLPLVTNHRHIWSFDREGGGGGSFRCKVGDFSVLAVFLKNVVLQGEVCYTFLKSPRNGQSCS